MKDYNVLIVEDESIPAHYIKKILLRAGYKVVGIASSKDLAFELMKNIPKLDLVLMDIKLKGSADGIETAKSLQFHYECAILFISAYSDSTVLERAKDVDAIGFLVKPIQESTLLSTIEIGMSNFAFKKDKFKTTLCDGSVFNAKEQIIQGSEKIVDLSHHETIILSLFLKDKNGLITNEQVESAFGGAEPLGQGALRTMIWRLRKKLPACINIENIYNSGYKIKF